MGSILASLIQPVYPLEIYKNPFLIAHPLLTNGEMRTNQNPNYETSFSSIDFFYGVIAYAKLVFYIIDKKYEQEKKCSETEEINTFKEHAVKLLNNLQKGEKTNFPLPFSELFELYNCLNIGILSKYPNRTLKIGGSSRVWEILEQQQLGVEAEYTRLTYTF